MKNETSKEISTELKNAVKALKQYWFGTRWEEMDIEDFEKLIKAISPVAYASVKPTLQKAFAVKDDNETKYMKRLDKAYDTVMFYYMMQRYMLGKIVISGMTTPGPSK